MVFTDNENLDETRTIPEVLFVDEDGNPIEGGKENFIYVDEAGNEIDDQIATQLIDSGNYLPSTYLNGVKKSNSKVNQASSSFGSFSKSSAGSQMAGEFQRKSSSNVLAQLNNSESAQNSAANLSQSAQGASQQDLNDLKKSQSARRIAQQPPAKQNSQPDLVQDQDHNSRRSVLSPEEISAAENAAKNQEETSRTQSRFSASSQEKNTLSLSQSDDIGGFGSYQVPGSSFNLPDNSYDGKNQDSPQIIGQSQSRQSQSRQSGANSDKNQASSISNSQSRSSGTRYSGSQVSANRSTRNSRASNSIAQSQQDTNDNELNDQEENIVIPAHLEGLCENFKCLKVIRVGELRGEDIQRFKDGTFDMEKIYEMYSDNDSDEQDEENIIDPFDPENFKDQIIDIDFGAVDAFTEALNAQLIAQKEGEEVTKELRFPSHVLTSNHSTFIENQMLLGDTNSEESNGVDVQFITDFKKFQDEKHYDLPEKYDSFSRANSFGSIIDVQSQKTYSSELKNGSNTDEYKNLRQKYEEENSQFRSQSNNNYSASFAAARSENNSNYNYPVN